jgi:hypothetical protein
VLFTAGNRDYDGTRHGDAFGRPGAGWLATITHASPVCRQKVGNAKAVSVTGIAVRGADAGNYAYKDAANDGGHHAAT